MFVYWLFRFGAAVAGRLPLWLGYALVDFAGAAAFRFRAGTRANVRDNLKHVLGPEVDPARLDELVLGVFRTGAKNYFDMLRMRATTAEEIASRVTIHGLEHLETALSEGRGAVMVTAHFGSFEYAAQKVALGGFKVIVPAEPIKPVALFDLVSKLRSTHGHQLIAAERGIVRNLVKSLRANAIVGFVVDRDAMGGGIPFELFGARTTLQPVAVTLARRERCPVVPVFAVRRPDNTSDIYFEPPMRMQTTEDEEADFRVNMRAVIAICERYIRQHPDQWVAFVPVWPAKEDRNDEGKAPVEPREPVGQGRPTHS